MLDATGNRFSILDAVCMGTTDDQAWIVQESESLGSPLSHECLRLLYGPERQDGQNCSEARTKGAKVHFASLMDICHLKSAELETKHQKYKGRIVFRCDIVKDDSGSYAVFTEQGSSASQMTAAKMWIYFKKTSVIRRTSSRRSIRVHPSQNGRCTDVFFFLEKKHLKIGMFRYLDTSCSSMEDAVFPLERNLYGHFLVGLL